MNELLRSSMQFPVLSSLLGICIPVLGYLIWLEIKEFRRRTRGRSHRRNPQGIAVAVRGIGFRSSTTLNEPSTASRIWTARVQNVDAWLPERPSFEEPVLSCLAQSGRTVVLTGQTRTA
jgi:hypothetical protein